MGNFLRAGTAYAILLDVDGAVPNAGQMGAINPINTMSWNLPEVVRNPA